jgi:hypothetical protein
MSKVFLHPSWLEAVLPDTEKQINLTQNDSIMLGIVRMVMDEGIELDYIRDKSNIIKIKGANFSSQNPYTISFQCQRGFRKTEIVKNYYLLQTPAILFYLTEEPIEFDQLNQYKLYGYPNDIHSVFIPNGENTKDQSIITLIVHIEKDLRYFFHDGKMIHFGEYEETDELPREFECIIELMIDLMVDRMQF